jgi:hypothetical protein
MTEVQFNLVVLINFYPRKHINLLKKDSGNKYLYSHNVQNNESPQQLVTEIKFSFIITHLILIYYISSILAHNRTEASI